MFRSAAFLYGTTVYLLFLGTISYAIGFVEERDLIARFGDRYRRYRHEVRMLLPLRKRTN